MIVIIPHQDDELKLIKLQNKLIDNINPTDKNIFFYKQQPLWIDITKLLDINNINHKEYETKPLLKTISKLIKTITIKNLKWESNQIKASVIISTYPNDNKTEIQLPLIKSYTSQFSKCNNIDENPDSYSLSDNIIEIMNLEKEISLKIFRLGITHKISDNSIAISESIWCKLK